MSYDIIFLIEEPSMKIVLEEILRKILPQSTRYICIPHQGKHDLRKSIPRKIKAFNRSNPETKFVILHDQDSKDCKDLKAELADLCEQAGRSDVLIRIVCRELESWFLGDLKAVEKAYQLPHKKLSKQQSRRKFRDPDQIDSAKEEVRKLVKEYYPGTHSKAIAPHLS
ncbi:MAG: DUF4276 family protein [Cyanobacteria bacterium J06554_6]